MGFLRGYGVGNVTKIGAWLILEIAFPSGIYLKHAGPWKFALPGRLGHMDFYQLPVLGR